MTETTTATAPVLVTMGAGKAVHYGYTGHMGQYVTLCDGWGGYGNRRTTVRRNTYAEAATCKKCLAIHPA